MNFERNTDPKKSLQIGQDCFAFKPNEIIWAQSEKPVHDWWIKTLLSGRRIYKYGLRDIFLRSNVRENGPKNYGRVGYSLSYLREHSEVLLYKYVLWKGVYYEL